MIGKHFLALIEHSGVTVTPDITFQALPDRLQDRLVEVVVKNSSALADECIPINSSSDTSKPALTFYDVPGAYVAAAFECVDQIGIDCMDTEALLTIGVDGKAAFELIGADPGAFFMKVKSAARVYLADTIDGIMRDAINDYLDKGEQQWH
jgi:hypothetical protein